MPVFLNQKRRDFFKEISKINFDFGFDVNILTDSKKTSSVLLAECVNLRDICKKRCKPAGKKSESTPYLLKIVKACEIIIIKLRAGINVTSGNIKGILDKEAGNKELLAALKEIENRKKDINGISKDLETLERELIAASKAKFKATTFGAVLDDKSIKKQLNTIANSVKRLIKYYDQLSKMYIDIENVVEKKLKNSNPKEIQINDLDNEEVKKFIEHRKKTREEIKQRIDKDLKEAKFSDPEIQRFNSYVYDSNGNLLKKFKDPKSTSLSLEHQKEALEAEKEAVLKELKNAIDERKNIELTEFYLEKLKYYEKEKLLDEKTIKRLKQSLAVNGAIKLFQKQWDGEVVGEVNKNMEKKGIKSF